MEKSGRNSWNKFEPSGNDDETMGNSFFTVGLFKISNSEQVREFLLFYSYF